MLADFRLSIAYLTKTYSAAGASRSLHYALNASNILLQDLVREIAAGAAMKVSNHVVFKLEDVAVGMWVDYVAREKGWTLNLVMDKGFNFISCRPYDVVSHYVKPEQMWCMFERPNRCCPAPKLGEQRRPKPMLRGGSET